MENEMLMVRNAKKDLRYFDLLYRKYFPKINNFVYHRVQDDGIKNEIVSNVFFNAMKKISHFRYFESRKSSFSSWLYRIAVNEVNQYYRDRKKEKKMSEILRWNDLPTDSDDDRDEEFKLIDEALKKFPQEQQNLIVLRFYEKLRYREIAEIMKKKEVTVKVQIHRILKKLKSNLEGDPRWSNLKKDYLI